MHHSIEKECPNEDTQFEYTKWRNSQGFTSGHYLYNLEKAKPNIQKTKSLILVESCGNVWKLLENEIYNVVAIFGSHLTPQQEMIISRLGYVNTIYTLFDNDKAGKLCSNDIHIRLYKRFNIKTIDFVNYNVNDISEMKNEQVKQLISGVI